MEPLSQIELKCANDNRDIIKEYLKINFYPELINIIISYYISSWNWKYAYSENRLCCNYAVMDNKIVNIYAACDVSDRIHFDKYNHITYDVSFEVRSVIDRIRFDKHNHIMHDISFDVRNVFFDSLYIYIINSKCIMNIHYYNKHINEVELYLQEEKGNMIHITEDILANIQDIKNGIVYTTVDNGEILYTPEKPCVKNVKLLLKNIILYADSITGEIYTKCNDFYRKKCHIDNMLVNNNGEIIVVNGASRHSHNILIYKVSDCQNIWGMTTRLFTRILYANDFEIIYTQRGNGDRTYLQCFNKTTKKICTCPYDRKSFIAHIDPNILILMNMYNIFTYRTDIFPLHKN